MKKIVLILLWPSILLFSQDFPINEQGKIVYTEIVNIDSSLTQEQLYLNAREWFARSFRSANDVIQMDDKDAGKLIGKGNFVIPGGMYLADGRVRFTISVFTKEGRYKYEITDFVHIANDNTYSGGNLENEKPDCGNFNMVKKGWLQVKEITQTKVNDIITDLKNSMNKTDSDVW
jgi:hypothetical protein